MWHTPASCVPWFMKPIWATTWQNQQNDCAPSEDLDQLGVRSVWSESLLCAQWVAKDLSFLHADSEDWSDWADAQADLSLRWAHRPHYWFCHVAAHITKILFWENPELLPTLFLLCHVSSLQFFQIIKFHFRYSVIWYNMTKLTPDREIRFYASQLETCCVTIVQHKYMYDVSVSKLTLLFLVYNSKNLKFP